MTVSLPPQSPAETSTPFLSILAQAQDLSITYPGQSQPVVHQVRFHLQTGQCHILRGPTGSGKSTLLKALAGLLSREWMQGSIQINDPTPAVILQNPETQLLSSTVGGECAFGLENQGLSIPEMEKRVQEALEAVGLDLPWSTPTRSLSMGQKYKLLLASFLSTASTLFLLDEPGTQLDSPGRRQLARCLQQRKAAGGGILLCEQHQSELEEVADFCWRLEQRELIPDHRPSRPCPPPPPRSCRPQTAPQPLIRVRDVELFASPPNPLLSQVNFRLDPGEFLLLTGANGSGKSTLIHCLAGFVAPASGQVQVLGDSPRPGKLQGRLGLVLQDPERQFFETTVQAELTFGLKRLGYPRHEQEALCTTWLQRTGLDSLGLQSPWSLSYGQKRLLGLASVLALQPGLLLLDDPCAGLDPDLHQLVLSLVQTEIQVHGLAVLWTAHEQQFACSPERHLHIQGGRLVQVG